MENIVLIITDCLRYDYFRKMRIFSECNHTLSDVYSSAPNTFFAVPSLLTGTLPFQIVKDGRINSGIFSYIPLIAERLGYSSIFITGNVVTSRAYGYFIPSGVFEDFISERELAPSDFGIVKVDRFAKIKNFLRKSVPHLYSLSRQVYRNLTWLLRRRKPKTQNTAFELKIRSERILKVLYELDFSSIKKPIFAFIHLMDTHAPYGSPKLSEKKLKLASTLVSKLYHSPYILKKKEVEVLKELYETEVEYLDESLQKLLDLIDRKLGLDKTLVIIISDHGEAFGEQGIFTHPGDGLVEEILHVPLAFLGGGAKKIKIEGEGVFPSWKIHEIIVKAMAGVENIKIQMVDNMVSIGYRRAQNSQAYIPTRLAFIDKSGIKNITELEEEGNKESLNDILAPMRRKYLRQQLRRELYGIKLQKKIT